MSQRIKHEWHKTDLMIVRWNMPAKTIISILTFVAVGLLAHDRASADPSVFMHAA